MSEIILVDENDREVGYAEKLAAHENGGQLHRAFSVFVYNSRGALLLQQRAAGKYHFGSMWTNTCCSHPLRGEVLEAAVHTRLRFEMGFDTELTEQLVFTYRATDEVSGLTEHEVDHVFVGEFDGMPEPNPKEVSDWRWASPADVRKELEDEPERYSPWFRIAFEKLSGSDVMQE